jgi:hypothetical protein
MGLNFALGSYLAGYVELRKAVPVDTKRWIP